MERRETRTFARLRFILHWLLEVQALATTNRYGLIQEVDLFESIPLRKGVCHLMDFVLPDPNPDYHVEVIAPSMLNIHDSSSISSRVRLWFHVYADITDVEQYQNNKTCLYHVFSNLYLCRP